MNGDFKKHHGKGSHLTNRISSNEILNKGAAMNCDDFGDWLHHQLDHHRQPIADDRVQNHLADCDSCRGQWDAWQQISTVLPTDHLRSVVAMPMVDATNDQHQPNQHQPVQQIIGPRKNASAAVVMLVACAASIGGLVFGITHLAVDGSPTKVAMDDVVVGAGDLHSPTDERLQADADATPDSGGSPQPSVDQPQPTSMLASMSIDQWWHEVNQRSWIDSTMPSVMPTVESVRQGVAPLGRSLVQAVGLLTRFGGGQT